MDPTDLDHILTANETMTATSNDTALQDIAVGKNLGSTTTIAPGIQLTHPVLVPTALPQQLAVAPDPWEINLHKPRSPEALLEA